MTAYTAQTSMNCTKASAKFAEASSCCASTAAYNCMGIILDVIIMASIFVVIISIIMGLRLSALVILSVIIISIIISSPVPLGLKRHRC